MIGIERCTNGSHDHAASSSNQTSSCFAREEDLVGIEGNAAKLTRWLLGDLEERNNKIATVWGMPGAGKTTLVYSL
jgi:disease resistance protein RPM1